MDKFMLFRISRWEKDAREAKRLVPVQEEPGGGGWEGVSGMREGKDATTSRGFRKETAFHRLTPGGQMRLEFKAQGLRRSRSVS